MPHWQTATIAGKPADVFAPPAAKFALLFLHPHGNETLAHTDANPAFTNALAEAGLACCCPVAPRTWWSSRVYEPFDAAISAEQHLLNHVLPWMRETWRVPERGVAVGGISMGGQGALRLGFRYANLFPFVAAIASAVDYHQRFDDAKFAELPQIYRSREQCRQDTATLAPRPPDVPRHLWFCCDPHDDDWYPGNDRLREKLRAVGVQHTADLETSRGGHDWSYFNAMARPMMQFVKDSLEREQRRLL